MDQPDVNPEQIEWEESSDVYKPACRPISDFLGSLNIRSDSNRVQGPYVFFSQEAWQSMQDHARNRLDCEQGGVLVGQAFVDTSGFHYLSVEAALPAIGAEASPTHLRFSSESWESICNTYRLQSHQTFVGWYHTHPGLGVFMSGTDKRTQSLFFNQDWHVAIVLDPKRGTIGFFYGPDAVPLKSYCLFEPKRIESPPANLVSPALLLSADTPVKSE